MKHTFSKQLTATLCHEVMTPLNSIINISGILQMTFMQNLKEQSLLKASAS